MNGESGGRIILDLPSLPSSTLSVPDRDKKDRENEELRAYFTGILDALETDTDGLKSLIRKERSALEKADGSRLREELTGTLAVIRNSLYASYRSMVETGEREGVYPAAVIRKLQAELERVTDGADGFTDGECLYLKCGEIPPGTGLDSAYYRLKRQRFFTDPLRDLVYRLWEEDPECRAFSDNSGRKTVSYLHVYPVSKREIPDTDNHHITQIHNAVTGVLSGGDSWDRCRIVMETVQDDRVPEGCYITVSPDVSGVFPDPAAIIGEWAKHFQSGTQYAKDRQQTGRFF